MSRLIEWVRSRLLRHDAPVGADADIALGKREHERLSRDLEQVKRVNEFLLDADVHAGVISPVEAATLRAMQPSQQEEERLRKELEIARLRLIAQARRPRD